MKLKKLTSFLILQNQACFNPQDPGYTEAILDFQTCVEEDVDQIYDGTIDYSDVNEVCEEVIVEVIKSQISCGIEVCDFDECEELEALENDLLAVNFQTGCTISTLDVCGVEIPNEYEDSDNSSTDVGDLFVIVTPVLAIIVVLQLILMLYLFYTKK